MFNSHCYSYVVYARKHGRDVKCPVAASGIHKLNIYNNMGGPGKRECLTAIQLSHIRAP
jgi:hypothetical protein